MVHIVRFNRITFQSAHVRILASKNLDGSRLTYYSGDVFSESDCSSKSQETGVRFVKQTASRWLLPHLIVYPVWCSLLQWHYRCSNLAGSIMTPFNKPKTPSTAIPSNRNGR